MPYTAPMRRVIFTADDFGLSASVNAAIVKAHRDGLLTHASLMVNGEAFGEAVQMAKENPDLRVGLHLTLVMGRPNQRSTAVRGPRPRSRRPSRSVAP